MDTPELQESVEEQQGAASEPPAPITSRFLFVDIAAMRAKQLRRGALPRLGQPEESETYRQVWHKPERVAMEEVKRGLVQYDVPPTPRSGREV